MLRTDLDATRAAGDGRSNRRNRCDRDEEISEAVAGDRDRGIMRVCVRTRCPASVRGLCALLRPGLARKDSEDASGVGIIAASRSENRQADHLPLPMVGLRPNDLTSGPRSVSRSVRSPRPQGEAIISETTGSWSRQETKGSWCPKVDTLGRSTTSPQPPGKGQGRWSLRRRMCLAPRWPWARGQGTDAAGLSRVLAHLGIVGWRKQDSVVYEESEEPSSRSPQPPSIVEKA